MYAQYVFFLWGGGIYAVYMHGTFWCIYECGASNSMCDLSV